MVGWMHILSTHTRRGFALHQRKMESGFKLRTHRVVSSTVGRMERSQRGEGIQYDDTGLPVLESMPKGPTGKVAWDHERSQRLRDIGEAHIVGLPTARPEAVAGLQYGVRDGLDISPETYARKTMRSGPIIGESKWDKLFFVLAWVLFLYTAQGLGADYARERAEMEAYGWGVQGFSAEQMQRMETKVEEVREAIKSDATALSALQADADVEFLRGKAVRSDESFGSLPGVVKYHQ